ncbi:response regulator transcription factor [Microbispora corallina]|uniref:DNA-binding response regulator n=1 Tax=Microbispora corallina TaxID=83302 RepID=A0ABQ4GBU4_9ACTN|nr:response regulator transcription factor [Microbispora corallina]GIH44551.1 DNA-binding response regulator [Microbispora corallina]
MSGLRVVIADDHPLFRDGLRTLLADLGAEVVAEVGDGSAAVAAVGTHRPDVVLMDLRMPGLDGIEATSRITRDHPGTTVLVLTMSDDAASLQAALNAGARGYLLKEASKADVGRALEAVMRGEILIGAGAAPRMRTITAGRTATTPFPQLTEREQELLELLARGLDNTAIARRLFLAEKTVRNRVSAIMAKLPAASRAEAIAIARDAGIGRTE